MNVADVKVDTIMYIADDTLYMDLPDYGWVKEDLFVDVTLTEIL